MHYQEKTPSNYPANRLTAFGLVLWIPLFGLWLTLLFPKIRRQESAYQQGLVLHFLWLAYFVVSSTLILLLNWIEPYFLGSFGEVVFRLHLVTVIVTYLVLATIGLMSGLGFGGEHTMAKWFQRSEILKKLQENIFPS